MATQEQIRQFFSERKGKPKVFKVGGKLSFNEMPKELQDEIKKRLAEKDPVIEAGLRGELPGLKIDGKAVTRDNIHEFEIKKTKIEQKKLEDMSKDELEAYALKFKIPIIKSVDLDKRRSKDKLIAEIKKLEVKNDGSKS